MENNNITLTVQGTVAHVLFNRPEVHNAITADMYERLEHFCDQLDANDDIRIVVFRGVGGKAFVSGTDIRQFENFDANEGVAYEHRIDRVIGRIERLRCTTVAVLEGVCTGGGAGLALACDFRYANEALRFGIPIARTLGNCLSQSNLARLVDVVGVSQAKNLLMLSKMMNASEALAVGAVTQVFPDAKLDIEVDAIVKHILTLAPLSLRATKLAILSTQLARRPDHKSGESLVRSCYGSQDFHNAVKAFLEHKRYDFMGR